jgi:hypothetical protein
MELMLVMGMLSIVSLLFVSYSGDVGDVSVDALSRKIQTDIRYAQQLATSKGSNHGVNFVQGSGYTVYDGNTSNPVLDPLTRFPFTEDLSHFGSITLGSSYQVEFDRLGRPVIGGGGDVTVVADGGASRKIYVIENTGAVVVDVLNYGSGCSCEVCTGGEWPQTGNMESR